MYKQLMQEIRIEKRMIWTRTNQSIEMEPFIFELDNRANKVEILRKEDISIVIKPKGYFSCLIKHLSST